MVVLYQVLLYMLNGGIGKIPPFFCKIIEPFTAKTRPYIGGVTYAEVATYLGRERDMTTARADARRRSSHIVVLIMMLWQCMLCCGTVLAVDTVSDFSVEHIQAAGVSDRAFAEAIFESISAHIEDGSYTVAPEESTEKILLEYGTTTENAEIRANGRNIREIAGIHLLRNATYIDLSENLISDLSPLAADPGIEEHLTYFGARELDLRGNPIARVPEKLRGFENGHYRLDSTLILPLPFYDRNGAIERRIVLHSTEQGEKAVVVRTCGEAEILQSVENAFQQSLTAVTSYRSSATEEESIGLRWSLPFDCRHVRAFRDELRLETVGDVELIAVTTEGEPLSGICYRLISESDNSNMRMPEYAEFCTDADGKLLISNLPSGSYRLEQQNFPPDCHSLQDTLRFMVADASVSVLSLSGRDTTSDRFDEIGHSEEVWQLYFSASGPFLGIEAEAVNSHMRNANLGIAHGFIADGDELGQLKGEILEHEGYVLLPESRVLLYEDERLLAVYSSPVEARQALNRRLREGNPQDGSQRILVTEELSCRERTQRLRAVFVKQTGRTIERIVVKKSWGADRTEEEAYFRPLLLRDGEVLAVLGEIKAVNTSNQWEAVWDLAASFSDARRSRSGRASASDAEEAELFREDALLFSGVLPYGCVIGVEEMNIPFGWIPQYEAVRYEGSEAVFLVCNQPEFPWKAETVMLTRNINPPIAGREMRKARRRQTERREKIRENTAERFHIEAARHEPETREMHVGTDGTGSDVSYETEENSEKRMLRERKRTKQQARTPLPRARLEHCKVHRGRPVHSYLRGKRLQSGKGAKTKRVGQKLPQTGERRQGICPDETLLLGLLMSLLLLQSVLKQCLHTNRGTDRC